MIKRCLDLPTALVLTLLLLPVMIVTAIAVRFKLGSPILFRQLRPGKEMKPFTLLKFRTMTDGVDPSGKLLPDEQRLTPFGLKLRRLSLDELPQLFNVIRGDMSLIGPRPLLIRYLPYFTEEEKKRFSIRPGITGLAQINGRNNIGWGGRFALDIKYVEEQTLVMDAIIVWQTIVKVIGRKDVAEAPSLTLPDLDDERRLWGRKDASKS
ncbi:MULTISPECIES: sugar transferase [Paenibacillus]|jgi:lipopolysaccharide/colanic/teichoic acid biosynthesis glycosyltransferase|uniref:Sugar transferase n=1 Tax=Paenibacillus baimaensis TaxID=2982185 RepID=A0ABT2UJC8_9BACL|nr:MULTISPECIES: sugar transferase [unclassified Paenibacillus]MCU6794226.1 sugar transferase [Paenibacillus sp. WQ 127069]